MPTFMTPVLPYDPSEAWQIMMHVSGEVLRVDPEVQQRQGLSEATIREYARLLTEDHDLGRIVVFHEGIDYWLADGFHRVEAARQIGLEELPAVCYAGGRREATLYACGANKHGVPRTPADKRHAVLALLQDEEWQQWSDREIARHCGVSHTIVGKQRRQLSGNGVQIRKVRRGTTIYDMQTSTIGKPAADADAETEATPVVQPAPLVDTPAVLPDESSVLVHAPTPLANGSTPRQREAALTVPAPTPDPDSGPPADQHIPYFHLDELVEESIHVLPEITSQLEMLADEYTTCTDEDGQPFPSAWTWITTPLPYGRGCDIGALHASVTLLATQLETLKAQAEASTTTPPTAPVTKRSQVLAVLPTIKPPITAPKVVAVTGLPIKVVRRALEGLTKVKATVKVRGKAGEYRLARTR